MSCQKAVQASTSDWSSRKARGCLASLLGRLRKFLTNSLGKHCTLKKHAKNHLHFVVAVVNLVNVYWLQSVFSFHWSSLIFCIGGCLPWSTDIALSSLILPEDAEPFLMFSLIWSGLISSTVYLISYFTYHLTMWCYQWILLVVCTNFFDLVGLLGISGRWLELVWSSWIFSCRFWPERCLMAKCLDSKSNQWWIMTKCLNLSWLSVCWKFSCLFVCYAWHAHLLICFSLVSCGLVRPPELLALTPHLALTNTIASPRGWNKPFIWNLDLNRRLLNFELVEIIDKGSNCGVSLARAFTTKECYRSWTWEAEGVSAREKEIRTWYACQDCLHLLLAVVRCRKLKSRCQRASKKEMKLSWIVRVQPLRLSHLGCVEISQCNQGRSSLKWSRRRAITSSAVARFSGKATSALCPET